MISRSGLVAMLLVLAITPVAWAGAAEAPQEEKFLQKGGLRLYPASKRIEMDGKFCLAEGAIELLACTKGGKEYESVIALDAKPDIAHFCLLVLGQKPGAKGSQLIVKVRWSQDGKERTVRAEQLCCDAKGQPLPISTWTFSGLPGGIAQDDAANVAAVWSGQLPAVISLPAPNGAADTVLSVNSKLVPKPGTPCTLILETVPPAK